MKFSVNPKPLCDYSLQFKKLLLIPQNGGSERTPGRSDSAPLRSLLVEVLKSSEMATRGQKDETANVFQPLHSHLLLFTLCGLYFLV